MTFATTISTPILCIIPAVGTAIGAATYFVLNTDIEPLSIPAPYATLAASLTLVSCCCIRRLHNSGYLTLREERNSEREEPSRHNIEAQIMNELSQTHEEHHPIALQIYENTYNRHPTADGSGGGAEPEEAPIEENLPRPENVSMTPRGHNSVHPEPETIDNTLIQSPNRWVSTYRLERAADSEINPRGH